MRVILQIFIDSIKESITGAHWKWLIGGVGSFLAILLLGKNFLNLELKWSILLGLAILFAIYSLRLFLIVTKNTIKHLHFRYRESIYGDAIIILRDSFSKIHSLRKNPEINDTEFIEAMVVFCNNLKSIFDKKTGKKCSVSIKVPIKGAINELTAVQNLCRDSVATKIRDTEIYKKTKHTIIGNTAFQIILNNILKGNRDKLHYINNNINSSVDYQNTSKDAYEGGKLPYDSELVYMLIGNFASNHFHIAQW